MDMLIGYSLYGISLLTVGGIYAILALGLNIQWGYAGLFNVCLLYTSPSPRDVEEGR